MAQNIMNKVVPREPTEEMYAAAEREWDGRMSARSAGVWQAMFDAAPQLQQSAERIAKDLWVHMPWWQRATNAAAAIAGWEIMRWLLGMLG